MDEEQLNQQIRKFLKKVGVTSQRELERVIRAAADSGELGSGKPLAVSMHLSLPALGLELDVEDELDV